MSNKVNITDFGLPNIPMSITAEAGSSRFEIYPVIPYEKLLDGIQWAINYILDDRTFVSAPIHNIVVDFMLVKYYTNIDCSELDRLSNDISNLYEMYDLLQCFDIPQKIRDNVQYRQLEFFTRTLSETLHSLVTYSNSAAGIIDRLTSKSKEDKHNMDEVLHMINDDEQMANVRKLFDLIAKDPV